MADEPIQENKAPQNTPDKKGEPVTHSLPSRSERLREVFFLFLRLGFTAFGGPAAHIAMMRDEVVKRRKWLSDERFVDLWGTCNLVPGPTSTELAIYLGYQRAGWPGLIIGGICFICPAMLIVLALAWAYVRFGSLPQVAWLFYGIKPVVVGIITYALWGLCRTVFKGIWQFVVALLVLVLYLLGVNVILLLFGGGILYGLVRIAQHWYQEKQQTPKVPLSSLAGIMTLRWKMSSVIIAAPVSLLTLFFTFLKIGAVAYGSGYVLLAFLRSDLVLNLHWLTDRQLLDAVSVGQFTPGPVFTTATFIGYIVGGFPGALLATLGIFLPSFVLIVLVHPIATRLRRSPWTAPLLDGVNVAALALMAGVLIQLGQSALVDILTWAIAVFSFGILLRFKINSAWLILCGAIIGVLRFWVFKV
ncbi:MAG TPA: chromate transporter [Ktedonobacteraceae bacterium]|jgi:chromate transporter|nr:chromate transporter [Ktedonobacteraceae bacterium]